MLVPLDELSRSNSKVKVIGKSSPLQEEQCSKVVGTTSSEGFLILKRVEAGRSAVDFGDDLCYENVFLSATSTADIHVCLLLDRQS